MKQIVLLICCVVSLFIGLSCTKEGPQEIPSDKLKSLLIDVAFMDSYAKLEMSDVKKDTVSLYEETFRKHGYTPEDVAYTLELLAKRKSNVAVVLLRDALEILEESKKEAKYRAELNSKWVAKAHQIINDTIYSKNEIDYLTSLDSLDKFVIQTPSIREGKYTVSYRYRIDSSDQNTLRYLKYSKRDTLTDKVNEQRSVWLAAKTDEHKYLSHDIVISRPDKRSNSIVFELIYLGGDSQKHAAPNMEIDSVLILYHYPDVVVSKMYLEQKMGIDTLKRLVQRIKSEIDEKNFNALRDKWRQSDTLSNYNN